jgi:hypothetical protein
MRRRWISAVVVVTAVGAGTVLWLSLRDDGSTQVPWRLVAEPSGSELQIRAEFGGSSCATFDRWRVDESSSTVDIRATAHIDDGDCTADLVFEQHAVELEAPLGDRRLVGCLAPDGDPDCTFVDRSP